MEVREIYPDRHIKVSKVASLNFMELYLSMTSMYSPYLEHGYISDFS